MDTRVLKLITQNQEKENNSELLNNNLRFNYSSQPTLSSSMNFPSRGNLMRLKEPGAAVGPVVFHKKLQEPRPKISLDPVLKYRTQESTSLARSEYDNYTEEYAAELYGYLSAKENRYGAFLKKHEIDHGLRSRMVDWMVEVLTSYKCSNRTFFKTVDLMDRYFQL